MKASRFLPSRKSSNSRQHNASAFFHAGNLTDFDIERGFTMAKFINGHTNYEEWRNVDRKTNNLYLARLAVTAKGITEFSDEFALVNAINVSEMSGKLEGYYSVSTSVLMNPICQARAKDPESICSKCYAAATASRYSGLADALETNYKILNGFLISELAWSTLAWPTTNGDARIESFGDVASVTCARNYLRIIKTHPHLNFAVWTKNPGIWKAAIKAEGGKPKNMKYILSSNKVNEPQEFDAESMALADHRFTVHDNNSNVTINCGGRKCATCRRCYADNTEFDVAERLK